VARAVVDEDQLTEDERVASGPRAEHESEAEQRGKDDVRVGPSRMPAVEPGRSEERDEGEGRRARQCRQGEARAAANREGWGGAGQQEGGREQDDEVQRLRLDLARDEDERRMNGGQGSRRDRQVPTPEEPRRERREQNRYERTHRRGREAAGRRALRMAERGD